MRARDRMGRILALLALSAGPCIASTAQPQQPAAGRAALAGTVRDTLGHPLSLVTVFAEGKDLATVTDDSGRFHLSGIPAGATRFTVMRLGFRAINFEATLSPDSTMVVEMRLHSVQTLPGIAVSGERQSAALVRSGFYERQKKGWGKFVSPEAVEKLRFVSTPAQLLRNVSGMYVRCGARERRLTGGGCVVSSSAGCVTLFVNGFYTRGELDARLGTAEVYAIETYNRAAIVPMEFTRPSSESRCGAIVVWTQARAPH